LAMAFVMAEPRRKGGKRKLFCGTNRAEIFESERGGVERVPATRRKGKGRGKVVRRARKGRIFFLSK